MPSKKTQRTQVKDLTRNTNVDSSKAQQVKGGVSKIPMPKPQDVVGTAGGVASSTVGGPAR